MQRKIKLSHKEQAFIKKLQALLAKAPKSLYLFGWSGALNVIKADETGFPCVVANYFEMQCDGGDPTAQELCSDAEIEYL